jgi:hypothetical protein
VAFGPVIEPTDTSVPFENASTVSSKKIKTDERIEHASTSCLVASIPQVETLPAGLESRSGNSIPQHHILHETFEPFQTSQADASNRRLSRLIQLEQLKACIQLSVETLEQH